jgi:hypothetical protein
MSKTLVLGAAVLAFSAASASAQTVYPGYGTPYGYNSAPYGYGYTAPAPLYDYAAPAYGYGAPAPGYGYEYTPSYWNRGYWIRRYGWQ